MADSPSPIFEAEQRAWRYWFADGLAHIVFGVIVLLFACCNFYLAHHRLNTLSAMAASTAVFVVLVLVLYRHRDIVEWLKTKVTYPRTGYVRTPFPEDLASPVTLVSLSLQEPASAFQNSFRNLVGALFGDLNATLSLPRTSTSQPEEAERLQTAGRIRQVFALALVSLAWASLVTLEMKNVNTPWACFVASALVASAAWAVRKDYRLSWLIVLGFPVIVLFMTIFLAARITGPDRTMYFIAAWGTLFLLDGAISLIRYILRNPMPKEPAA